MVDPSWHCMLTLMDEPLKNLFALNQLIFGFLFLMYRRFRSALAKLIHYMLKYFVLDIFVNTSTLYLVLN